MKQTKFVNYNNIFFAKYENKKQIEKTLKRFIEDELNSICVINKERINEIVKNGYTNQLLNINISLVTEQYIKELIQKDELPELFKLNEDNEIETHFINRFECSGKSCEFCKEFFL